MSAEMAAKIPMSGQKKLSVKKKKKEKKKHQYCYYQVHTYNINNMSVYTDMARSMWPPDPNA